MYRYKNNDPMSQAGHHASLGAWTMAMGFCFSQERRDHHEAPTALIIYRYMESRFDVGVLGIGLVPFRTVLGRPICHGLPWLSLLARRTQWQWQWQHGRFKLL